MSDNLRSQSSPIRNILDEVISSDDESNGNDIDVGNIPSDHSLTDFSSGSSEEYVPDYEDLETSDKETPGNEDDISDNGSVVGDRPAGRLNPWLRIYPPKPEKDIRPQFQVRNPGIKNCPPPVKNADLEPRETIYFRKGDLLLVKFKQRAGKKPVFALTTACHAEDQLIRSKKGLEGMKPLLIHKYNQDMGGVDPMDRRNFIVSIVDTLGASEEPVVVGPAGDAGPDPHRLERLPGVQMRKCVVCNKGRSTFWCPGCNCGVHPKCYHLQKHFWRPMRGGKKRRRRESSSSSSD
ncbi:hypothetical protein J6590_047606 [Homalodisca vitripennis]|nr:hypothetical protein J6590_047606 [Homalodisca vitripennis]